MKSFVKMISPASGRDFETIPISMIVRSSVCPLRVYLERHEPIEEPYAYTIAKQVGYHLGSERDAEMIWDEIRVVRPEIPDTMRSYLNDCITAWDGISWEIPRATDISVKNVKYAITGRIDWLFDTEPEIGILRATRAPTYGVWRQDRIRAAAYLLASEEMNAELFNSARIIYLPSGIVRPVVPGISDRRSLFSSLRQVEAIYRGEMPKAPPNAPCDRCPKKEVCRREPTTLFDRFFRRS
jgi:CRISPR-associated exonuclease Cas4